MKFEELKNLDEFYAVVIRSTMTDAAEWVMGSNYSEMQQNAEMIYGEFKSALSADDNEEAIAKFEKDYQNAGYVVFFDENDLVDFEYDEDQELYTYKDIPITVVKTYGFRY